MEKRLLVIIKILLFLLLTSFSSSNKNSELTLRNIEALTKGEEPDDSDCIIEIGFCIVQDVKHKGMILKN